MQSQINMEYNFIKWYTFDSYLPKSAPLHRWPFVLHFPSIVMNSWIDWSGRDISVHLTVFEVGGDFSYFYISEKQIISQWFWVFKRGLC